MALVSLGRVPMKSRTESANSQADRDANPALISPKASSISPPSELLLVGEGVQAPGVSDVQGVIRDSRGRRHPLPKFRVPNHDHGCRGAGF